MDSRRLPGAVRKVETALAAAVQLAEARSDADRNSASHKQMQGNPDRRFISQLSDVGDTRRCSGTGEDSAVHRRGPGEIGSLTGHWAGVAACARQRNSSASLQGSSRACRGVAGGGGAASLGCGHHLKSKRLTALLIVFSGDGELRLVRLEASCVSLLASAEALPQVLPLRSALIKRASRTALEIRPVGAKRLVLAFATPVRPSNPVLVCSSPDLSLKVAAQEWLDALQAAASLPPDENEVPLAVRACITHSRSLLSSTTARIRATTCGGAGDRGFCGRLGDRDWSRAAEQIGSEKRGGGGGRCAAACRFRPRRW